LSFRGLRRSNLGCASLGPREAYLSGGLPRRRTRAPHRWQTRRPR